MLQGKRGSEPRGSRDGNVFQEQFVFVSNLPLLIKVSRAFLSFFFSVYFTFSVYFFVYSVHATTNQNIYTFGFIFQKPNVKYLQNSILINQFSWLSRYAEETAEVKKKWFAIFLCYYLWFFQIVLSSSNKLERWVITQKTFRTVKNGKIVLTLKSFFSCFQSFIFFHLFNVKYFRAP